jgi:hypothetical protein
MNNNALKAHTPNMYYYGTFKDDTRKILKGTTKYYLRSEAITNLPLQDAIKYKCQNLALSDIKDDDKRKFYEMLYNNVHNWRLVILQLFNILSVMTVNYFNHCDFHGDNILLAEMPEGGELKLDFSYLGIKDPPYVVDDTCLLMKIIDFDTGKFMETTPKIVYCTNWKSSRSGITTLLPKANELRKTCGLSYKTNTVKNLPMGNWLLSRSNPVNGDWFNFGHFMACLAKSNIFPNLDMKNLWRIIRKFNQNKMNAYFNKHDRSIDKLNEYIKHYLQKIYFNLRS